MKRWYALHTRPYAERRVAEQLERCDVETFVPGITAGGEKEKRFRPLFPGYLFIRISLKHPQMARWLSFPGVRYIVAYGDEPVPVLDDAVALLKRKIAALRDESKDAQPQFKPGVPVRIKDGPFRDMIGVFEGRGGPSQRVRVLLEALSRSMRLQIDPSLLDAVDGPADQPRKKRPRRTRGRGRPIRS
ncbi:MAG TPA: transcription termination/antitermination NusG family protein [Candidatus Binatia bacterium]|jgi:transcriptional antiterminator RfaH|nr:transcription termination/antitermination NusG family protein [Candidatus Binatia bacterium]